MINNRFSFPNALPDDELWAAYRRHDKIAVTATLFDRSIRRICWGQVLRKQKGDAVRQAVEDLLVNTR
jgi:hypothetical protein